MKPRQPVAVRLQRPGAKSSPTDSGSGKDGKSARQFSNLFSADEKGFFVASWAANLKTVS
jgi:hypothetical protein